MPEPYCGDCPDHEACYLGASCDFTKQANAVLTQFNRALEGKTIMAAKNFNPKNVSTVEEKTEGDVTIPEQTEPAAEEKDGPQLVAVDTKYEDSKEPERGQDKLTFKERVAGLTSLMKTKKKQLAITVGVVATATLAVAAYVSQLKQDEVVDEDAEIDLDEVAQDLDTPDEVVEAV